MINNPSAIDVNLRSLSFHVIQPLDSSLSATPASATLLSRIFFPRVKSPTRCYIVAES